MTRASGARKRGNMVVRMTEQEARDCEHEYEAVPYAQNLYRCPKGCDYFVRSLRTLEEVRATEQRRREASEAGKRT